MDFKPGSVGALNRLTNEQLLQFAKNDTQLRLAIERQGKGVVFNTEVAPRYSGYHNHWTKYYTIPNKIVGTGRMLHVKLTIPYTYASQAYWDGQEWHVGAYNRTTGAATPHISTASSIDTIDYGLGGLLSHYNVESNAILNVTDYCPLSYVKIVKKNGTNPGTIGWFTRQARLQDANPTGVFPDIGVSPTHVANPRGNWIPTFAWDGAPVAGCEMPQTINISCVVPTYDVDNIDLEVQILCVAGILYCDTGILSVEDVGAMLV